MIQSWLCVYSKEANSGCWRHVLTLPMLIATSLILVTIRNLLRCLSVVGMEMVWLPSPGWLHLHGHPPASVSCVLGLQDHTTMPSMISFWFWQLSHTLFSQQFMLINHLMVWYWLSLSMEEISVLIHLIGSHIGRELTDVKESVLIKPIHAKFK